MTVAAIVTVSGSVSGMPEGQISFGASIVDSTAPVGVTTVTLLSGVNTITIPTGAQGCFFVPYAANVQTLTLKGNSGDTGLPLHVTNPIVLSFGGNSTFLVVAGGNTGGGSEVYFF